MSLSVDVDRSGGRHHGRVYIAFADQEDMDGDPDFGLSNPDHIDTGIFVIASDTRAATWNALGAMPVRVNDDVSRGSQFLSWLDIDQATGNLAISWHDTRYDTGAGGPGDTNGMPNDDSQYFAATSTDGGASFSPNIQVSDGTSDGGGGGSDGDPDGGVLFGHLEYTGLAFFNNVVHMAWSDNSDSTRDNPEGTLGNHDVYYDRLLPPVVDCTVTSTFDLFPRGTLRAAIECANAAAGPALIDFRIPVTDPNFQDVDSGLSGGDADADVFVITPLSPLPALNNIFGFSITVDGLTEAAVVGDANPFGPEIVLDGASAGPIADGLHLLSGINEVRGLNIQQFGGNGIRISGAGNVVRGNFIGSDATGRSDRGNRKSGIEVDNARDNWIGGSGPGDGNVIADNDLDGIAIVRKGSTRNRVVGNLIGTDAAGRAPLGNRFHGVSIDDASGNIVGGTSAAERNLISANGFNGVSLSRAGAAVNVVRGNFIGTDVLGTGELGNGFYGVHIDNAPSNTIGGSALGSGNVISANGVTGLFIGGEAATGNAVLGNFIGTDVYGTSALGNRFDGVHLDHAARNRIGGPSDGERNIISRNGSEGVEIYGAGATGNVLEGNFIGVDAAGAPTLGNGGAGVLVLGGASNNRVGSDGRDAQTDASEGNRIADNGGAGVRVQDADTVQNRVRGNQVFDNGSLGIDLGSDGVTPNDKHDPDTGPNELQNFPELVVAGAEGTGTRVGGVLKSLRSSRFTIDFYANAAADSTGFGEGQRWLGTRVVTTGPGGVAHFSFLLDAMTSRRECVTATVTDPAGNTSEFSQCKFNIVLPIGPWGLFDADLLTIFGTAGPDILQMSTDNSGAIVVTNERTKTPIPVVDASTGQLCGQQGACPTIDNTRQIAAFLDEGGDSFGADVSSLRQMLIHYDGGADRDELRVTGNDLADLVEITGVRGPQTPSAQIRWTELNTGQLRADLSVNDTEAISVDTAGGGDHLIMREQQHPLFNVDWTIVMGTEDDTFDARLGGLPDVLRVLTDEGNDHVQLIFADGGVGQAPRDQTAAPSEIIVNVGAGVDSVMLDVFGSLVTPLNNQSGISAQVTLVEVLASIYIQGVGLLSLLTLFPLGAVSMAQSIRDDRAGETNTDIAMLLDGPNFTTELSTGATEDTILVDLSLRPESELALRLATFDGNDTVRVNAEVTTADLDSPIVQQRVRLAGGAGDDVLSVTLQKVRAMDVTMLGDAGRDSLQLNAEIETEDVERPAVQQKVRLVAGAGRDTVTALVSLPPGPASIMADVGLGSGNDTGKFQITRPGQLPNPSAPKIDVVLNILAGAGNDRFGASLGLGQVRGSLIANLFGQSGNDTLGLFIDAILDSNRRRALLDGGPGRDTCSASKNVRVINCER